MFKYKKKIIHKAHAKLHNHACTYKIFKFRTKKIHTTPSMVSGGKLTRADTTHPYYGNWKDYFSCRSRLLFAVSNPGTVKPDRFVELI